MAASPLLGALAASRAKASPIPAAPPVLPLSPPGASIRYLTSDPAYQDARPCFDPTGKFVLFMHQPVKGRDSTQIPLYTIPVARATPWPFACQKPDLFYFDQSVQATRPDWSWSRTSFEIAFSGNSKELYLLDVKTRKAQLVNCTAPESPEILSYPSWSKDGQTIVLTNYTTDPSKQRLLRTSAIPQMPPDPFSVACTNETNPDDVWPGMSSVSPSNADLVAFAGQTPNLAKTYDQNWNQIWVKKGTEPAAQVNGILGRAPWWSPSGTAIAYESVLTPEDGYNPFYRIWVLPVNLDSTPSVGAGQLVTPPNLPVQHAKWSPDGKQIVFAYTIPWAVPANGNAAQGIAIVDVPLT